MKIKRLENYHTSENTYFVYNNKTAFVIDPGYKLEGILKVAEEENVQIKYILVTHCHYDHIESLEALRENTGAKVIASYKASINIGDPIVNLTSAFSREEISAKKAEIILKDGEEFDIDGMKIKCIYTPGHTNCGACFICEGHIFTGDTLFLRQIGRYDLPTANEEELFSSIKNKLYTLDENLIVHPGHGDDTTIGYEKKFNFYVKG